MPSIKEFAKMPKRIAQGAKLGLIALLVIILLQGVIIWLLLTRLPAPTS